MRKAFEAWMKSQNPKYKPTDDSMVDRLLWTTWQAATERAAKVCEEAVCCEDKGPDGVCCGQLRHQTADECAARIRAMVKP